MDRVRAKTHAISDSEGSDEDEKGSHSAPQKDFFSGSDDLFGDDSDDSTRVRVSSKLKVKKDVSHSRSKKGRDENVAASRGDKSETENGAAYDADTDVEETEDSPGAAAEAAACSTGERKSLCKYGSKCYRKNESHLQEFFHPRDKRKSGEHAGTKGTNRSPKKLKSDPGLESVSDKTKPRVLRVFDACQPYGFFLTRVSGVQSQFNDCGVMSLKDILSPEMGQLKCSCHFNFMFEVPWLMQQYAHTDRSLPLLLVHGDQGRAELDLKAEASPYPNISLCRARLDIPYGTHHTKMMFLLYNTGLRVVVHTANLIPNDWHQKTQGIWISPIFPPFKSSPSDLGDSRTEFKAHLLQYVRAYKSSKLTAWEKIISEHNMASANVHIVASVPGRHTLQEKHHWGHLKLKKILSAGGPDPGLVKNWPVIAQFSSIGSLGANPDAWLLSEWGLSVGTCAKSLPSPLISSKLQLIFPSKDNIRLSLEGYNGGGCVPYSIKTASKQPWLTPFFCQWKSEGRGRSRAVPHIKTYTRSSPDGSQAAWFMVTSANLSKAAWGATEKKGSQLMIRSYEMGVLFLPGDFGCKNSFKVSSHLGELTDPDVKAFPLPYDLPPSTYIKGDRPWFCDVPCMDAPDTFGNMWCPPL